MTGIKKDTDSVKVSDKIWYTVFESVLKKYSRIFHYSVLLILVPCDGQEISMAAYMLDAITLEFGCLGGWTFLPRSNNSHILCAGFFRALIQAMRTRGGNSIGLDGYPIQPIVFHQFWIGFGYNLEN